MHLLQYEASFPFVLLLQSLLGSNLVVKCKSVPPENQCISKIDTKQESSSVHVDC